MSLHCSNCNGTLDSRFKFCPHCGVVLNIVNSSKEEIDSFLICNVCGETNDKSNQFCSGCGAKLSLKGIDKAELTSRKNKKKDNVKRSSKKEKQDLINTEDTGTFSSGKIIVLFSGILAIGLIILYSAGIFDSSVKQSGEVLNQNFSSGVDLNNVQKINQLREKAKANPDDYKTVLELGHLLMDSGFFTEAITNYEKYIAKHPEDADVIIDMGVCYFEMNQLDRADSIMKSALVFNPGHQIGHLNIGVVNLKKGNSETAKEWFRKTIEINPATEHAQRAKQLLESH